VPTRLRTSARETPAEILAAGPSCVSANAAAQTRIVSDGRLWPGRRELSRYFKYMARARIPEFESYHPSHAVGSLRCDFRACETILRPKREAC
jgi:hypothetical protein